MSVTFYGLTIEREPISLDIEHPAHLNMASSNARAFLSFMGIEPGPDPSGETSLPEARRAVMKARALFERRVDNFTREASNTRRPGRCRVVECGIDVSYFAMRLTSFAAFLGVVEERGARSIFWA